MLNSKFVRVLFAGVWFAVAAVVPIVYVFARFGEVSLLFGNSVLMTTALPITISGICGALLGLSIFDGEEIQNGLQATLRGLMVAALAYLLMFTIPAIILAFYTPDLLGLIIYGLFLFAYGLLFVGWLAAAVGAAAGLLLYLCRLKFFEEEKL